MSTRGGGPIKSSKIGCFEKARNVETIVFLPSMRGRIARPQEVFLIPLAVCHAEIVECNVLIPHAVLVLALPLPTASVATPISLPSVVPAPH